MGLRLILKNLSSLLISQVISTVLSFIVSVITIRYLGITRNGEYIYITSFAAIFGLLANFGLPSLLIREVSKNKKNAGLYIYNALIIQIFLSIIIFIFTTVLTFIINDKMVVNFGIILCILSSALFSFASIYNNILIAFEYASQSAKINIICSLITSILTLLTVYLKGGVIMLCAILIFYSLILLILLRRSCIQNIDYLKGYFDKSLIEYLLKGSIPFVIMLILNNVYTRIDIVMLEHLKGTDSVGIYSAGVKILYILIAFVGVFGVTIYPRLSANFGNNPAIISLTTEKAYKYMCAIGIGIAVMFTMTAKSLIVFLFGREFSSAAIVLQILSWSAAFTFMLNSSLQLINASGNEKYWNIILLIDSVFNIMLNLVIIPKYDYIGASMTTLFCEVITFCMVVYVVRTKISRVNYFTGIPHIIIASIIMAVILYFLKNLYILLLIFLGGGVYIGALLLMKFISSDEKEMIQNVFQKRQPI